MDNGAHFFLTKKCQLSISCTIAGLDTDIVTIVSIENYRETNIYKL